MGIKGLYSTVDSLFPGCITRVDPNVASRMDFDHIFFDINNILYLGNEDKLEGFLKEMITFLENVLQLFPPKKSVYLAIDGPAPLAKLCTQIERRAGKSKGKSEDKSEVQSLMFTPGSKIMLDLKTRLVEYATMKISTQLPTVQFFISGADRPGEGEAKIFQHISEKLHGDKGNCLIIGNDSDLVLFGLRSKEHQIYTLRFNSFFILGTAKIYNTLALKQQIFTLLGSNDPRVIDDFCLLALFCGNDYFPKLAHYNFRKSLMEYKKIRETNPDEFLWDPEKGLNRNIIDLFTSKLTTQYRPKPWDLLGQVKDTYFRHLVYNCEFEAKDDVWHCKVLLQDIHIASGEGKMKQNAKNAAGHQLIENPNLLVEALHKLIPNFQSEVTVRNGLKFEAYINTQPAIEEADTEADEKDELRITEEDIGIISTANNPEVKLLRTSGNFLRVVVEAENKEASCRRYVEGLVWTMRYLSGKLPNFTYMYPYTNAVSLADFQEYSFPPIELNDSLAHPLTPLETLTALMPKRGLHILPEPIKIAAEVKLHHLYSRSTLSSLIANWQVNMSTWLEVIRTIVREIPKESFNEGEISQLTPQPTLKVFRGFLPGAPGVFADMSYKTEKYRRSARYMQIFKESSVVSHDTVYEPYLDYYPAEQRNNPQLLSQRQFSTLAASSTVNALRPQPRLIAGVLGSSSSQVLFITRLLLRK